MPTELIQRLQFFIDLNAKGFKSGGKDISKTMLDMSNKLKANNSGFAKFARALNKAQAEMLELQGAYTKNNVTSKELEMRQKQIAEAFNKSIPKSKEFRQSLLLVVDSVKRLNAAEEKQLVAEKRLQAIKAKVINTIKQEKNALMASRNALTRRTNAVNKSIKASGLEGTALKHLKGIIKEITIKRKILDTREKAGVITKRRAISATKGLNASLIDLQVRGFAGSRKALKRHILGLKEASNASIRMGGATTGVMRILSRWRNRLLVATFALAGLIRVIKGFVNVAIEAEKQTIALNIVALKTGNTVEGITKAAKDLARDGVLSFIGAAQAIKNLISTGASIGIVVKNLQAMKDAALANGLASLTAEEAIIRYTQGVKENKSVLTDTAGIMTNISVLLKRAEKNTSDLSQADKLLIEFTKEAGLFSGTLSKSLKTLGGQLQVAKTAAKSLAIELGEKLVPITKVLVGEYLEVIRSISEWAENQENLKEVLESAERIIIDVLGVTLALIKLIALLGKAYRITTGIMDTFEEKMGKLGNSMISLSITIKDEVIRTLKTFSMLLKLGIVNGQDFSKEAKNVAKALEEIVLITEGSTNQLEMTRLRNIMDEISKSVKDRTKNTNELKASILELSGQEREAFRLRMDFNRREQQAEIDLLKIKLDSAEKLEQRLKLNLRKQIKGLAVTQFVATMEGNRKEVVRLTIEMNRLQRNIDNIDESTINWEKDLAALNEESRLLDENFRKLMETFKKSGKAGDNAFLNFQNRLRDIQTGFDINPPTEFGGVSRLRDIGAPRAAALDRRELIRHKKSLDDIQKLRDQGRISNENADRLIEQEDKLHQDRRSDVARFGYEERLKMAVDFGKKLLNMTVIQGIKDSNALKLSQAVAREKVKIELEKGVIDKSESIKQLNIIRDQGVLQEKASDKRRLAGVQEAVAAELLAKAVLWAIEGPIQILKGNFALGAAYIAGAVAAGLAVGGLLRSSGNLRTEAAVIDVRADALADENRPFEGQGRTITGSFTTPLGGFGTLPNINFNAGEGIIVFGTDIEEVTDTFKTAIQKATQEGLDSGEVQVPV